MKVDENSTRPNYWTSRPNTADQVTTACHRANGIAAAWNLSYSISVDIGCSKIQPVTNDNEVRADAAFVIAHRRRIPRAPLLDARKSRGWRLKTIIMP